MSLAVLNLTRTYWKMTNFKIMLLAEKALRLDLPRVLKIISVFF